MKSRLTWLHLSDIHFTGGGGRREAEWRHVRDELLHDLRDRERRYGGPAPDFAVVTGDIADTGGALSGDEYAAARQSLDRVGEATGLDRERMYCVPGNHDVRRSTSADPDVRRWLRELRAGEATIDDVFDDPHGMKRLRDRFDGYVAFAADFGTAGATTTIDGLAWSARLAFGTDTVGIAGINTALLSDDDFDESVLQVGQRQLNECLDALADVDLVLALTHHPLSWVRDGSRVAARFRDRVDFHLFGHLHAAQVSYSKDFGRAALVRFQAGAVFEPVGVSWRPGGAYRYNLISVEVRDNTLEVVLWPRVWVPDDDTFGADATLTGGASACLAETVPRRTRREPPAPKPRTAKRTNHSHRALARVSEGFTTRMGRRRTAYPLDMSLAQLHSRDLFVPSRLTPYHEGSAAPGERAVSAIVATLDRGESVLLLGEPGSGKSLTVYEVAMALRAAGRKPIPMRAMEIDSLLGSDDWPVLRQGRPEAAVVLVDGLDEAIDQIGGAALQDAIDQVSRRGSLLVTSRAREYEETIVFDTADATFDEVFVLHPWAVDVEFADYLARLTREGLVEEPRLYQAVVASERLSRLVSRPLYARMLTFIGAANVHRIPDTAHLYGEYLAKLSTATDAATARRTRSRPLRALPIWQAVARQVHLDGLSPNSVPMAKVESALATDGTLGAVRRIVDQIIDRRGLHGQEVGAFLHYSFYEYLVARAVADELARTSTVAEVVRTLSRDLTREIRHHLVGDLRGYADAHFTDTLLRLYREVRTAAEVSEPDRLSVCNLLAYLISRTDPGGTEYLSQLLAGERDNFLTQSLLWALCHVGHRPALDDFFDRLETDDTFRAQCRGYYLYYYGDIDAQPPVFDTPPFVPYQRTLTRVLARLASPEFRSLAPEQACADLYTFLDIVNVRSDVLGDADGRVVRATVRALRQGSAPARVTDRLLSLLDAATTPRSAETGATINREEGRL